MKNAKLLHGVWIDLEEHGEEVELLFISPGLQDEVSGEHPSSFHPTLSSKSTIGCAVSTFCSKTNAMMPADIGTCFGSL